MKIIMLGWELPPHNSGGLGIACYGLCQALANDGMNVEFILPYSNFGKNTKNHFMGGKSFCHLSVDFYIIQAGYFSCIHAKRNFFRGCDSLFFDGFPV